MTQAEQQLVFCSLVLIDGHWAPLGVNAKLTNKHRSSADGPVITAYFVVEVDGRQVVNWGEPRFGVINLKEDGSLDYDPAEITAILEAPQLDEDARMVGAIGINDLLIKRRQERDQSAITPQLKTAAYDRAVIQITDWLHGVRTTGVTRIPT